MFPYVFDVFSPHFCHCAPALTSGVLFKVLFRFGGMSQTILFVFRAWEFFFAFIFKKNTPTKNYAMICPYWRVFIFLVKIEHVSVLFTKSCKIFLPFLVILTPLVKYFGVFQYFPVF